ncbi:Type II secretion system protein F [Chlamydiales bacterium STE3]|nr:Type II secretion system protein F [Chlamydiales bacterium STE3]
MPVYYYQALDQRGKRRKGFVEAIDEKEAKAKLRTQGVMVTKLTTKGNMGLKLNLSRDQLLSFTVMLSQLVSSGIPLYESLLAIEEQSRLEPYHRIIASLCEQIKAGATLSAAMGNFSGSFDGLYCAMIGAGEAAGALDIVLLRLSQFLTKQVALRKTIKNAMIYPALLASFAFLAIIMLLGFVVPSIEGLFADRKLNGYTQFVLSLSHFVRENYWIYLPLLGGLSAWMVYELRKPRGQLWVEKQLMKLPLISTLMVQAAMARFSRTMATLLEGGLPLIEALKLSRHVMQNATLEEEISRAEHKIVEGGSLSNELRRSRLIPHLVPRMLSVGEESGRIVEMLTKIADMYENNLEKTIDQVMALMQPIILIVMGAIIGMVLLAILLPMTDISSLSLQM